MLLRKPLQLQLVLLPALLQPAQGVAHGLAGVLVFPGLDHLLDEIILVIGQVDVSGRHGGAPFYARSLLSLAIIANW